jgi:hypothetical protein
MFHLLPLLKGWEYKTHLLWKASVKRGAVPVEIPISEIGWLLGISEITGDCYGTAEIEWQGADLQTLSLRVNPEALAQLGAFQQDPSSWVQLYRRPNPYSTAGLFVVVIFSGGFQGSTLPYVPTVKLRVSLPAESMQTEAFIELTTTNIAITDKKMFIQSLRRVLDANASLEIDKALEVIGRSEPFEEKAKK